MKNKSWLSPYKTVNHMERILSFASGELTYPVHIELHPTTRCNHRCKRCAAVIPKISGKRRLKLAYKRNTDIPMERLISLIDEFAGAGVKAITLCGGGEPLIYDGIEEVMSLILDRGMDLGIITNLNVEMNDRLLGLLRRAVFIRVSLDAASSRVYKLLHRPIDGGDINRVLDCIRSIVGKGPDVGVNYLVQEENHMEIERAAALARDLNTTYIRFTPTHTIEEGREYLPLWDRIVEQMEAARKYESDEFTVLGAVERFKNMVENRKDYPKCIYHEFHPIVGADLNMYPCCVLNYFEEYVMADLSSKTFRESWDSIERKRFSRDLNAGICPPCWFDEQNRLMNYITLGEKLHGNFL